MSTQQAEAAAQQPAVSSVNLVLSRCLEGGWEQYNWCPSMSQKQYGLNLYTVHISQLERGSILIGEALMMMVVDASSAEARYFTGRRLLRNWK